MPDAVRVDLGPDPGAGRVEDLLGLVEQRRRRAVVEAGRLGGVGGVVSEP